MNNHENMNTAVMMITQPSDGFLFVDPEGKFGEYEWKRGSRVKILHVVL